MCIRDRFEDNIIDEPATEVRDIYADEVVEAPQELPTEEEAK